MNNKIVEVYCSQVDEGQYDYVGRIGTNTLRCRICKEKFEKHIIDNKQNALMTEGTEDLIDHYKQKHSSFIKDNKLEFYTGFDDKINPTNSDFPYIIIVKDLNAHQPTTNPNEPYIHLYLLRAKKGILSEISIQKESLIPKALWTTIYKNVGEEKLGECLLKLLHALVTKEDLKKNVRFAIYKNKLDNWSISSITLKGAPDTEGIFNTEFEFDEPAE